MVYVCRLSDELYEIEWLIIICHLGTYPKLLELMGRSCVVAGGQVEEMTTELL